MVRTRRKEKPPFSDEDKEALLNLGEDILNLDPEKKAAAWEKWAAHSEVSLHKIVNNHLLTEARLMESILRRNGKTCGNITFGPLT